MLEVSGLDAWYGEAQALRDAENRECSEVRRDRQQGRGNSEQGETQENAEPPIDVLTEKADDKPGHGHSHSAGVDREAHRCGRHVVMPGQ